jgi:hypothetical protein
VVKLFSSEALAMAYFTPGNGHENGGAWPKGRRRNPHDVSKEIAELRSLGLSWRDLEQLTGVSTRQLRKYASSEQFAPDRVERRLMALVKRYV